MGVQLTPGQRYLLDILQKKLIGTLQIYAKLSRERRDLLQKLAHGQEYLVYDGELARLREKIKRISARQKRFTSEIINGNGNNTIPKESFFKALGLVTKETLSQINSKSNERRRRTTANPRFSHEAIQAKKALQKPRVESKVTRDKKNASANNSNATATTTNNNSTNPANITNATTATSNTLSIATITRQRINTNTNSNSNNNNTIPDPEILPTLKQESEILEEFKVLRGLMHEKAGQLKAKLEQKQRIDEENKMLVTIIKRLCAINGSALVEGLSDSQIYRIANLSQVISSSPPSTATSASASSGSSASSSSSSSTSTSPQPVTAVSRPDELLACQALASLVDRSNPTTTAATTFNTPQLVDIWLKCDESLDGLD